MAAKQESERKDELSVFGYLRQQELLLLQGTLVPPPIYHLCLIYYHIREFWAAYDEEAFQVNEEQNTMTNCLQYHLVGIEKAMRLCKLIWGNVQTGVSFQGIYKWKLKIIGYDAFPESQLYIGFDASADFKEHLRAAPDAYDVRHGVHPSEETPRKYLFSAAGCKASWDTEETDEYGDIFAKTGFRPDDVIEIELNTVAKTIRLSVNEQHQGTAFENVDVSVTYRLMVYANWNDTSVQIVDFQQIYVHSK